MTGSQRIRLPKEWEARNPVGLNLARTPPEDEGRSENPGARGPVGVSSCLSWAGSAPNLAAAWALARGTAARVRGASAGARVGRQGLESPRVPAARAQRRLPSAALSQTQKGRRREGRRES